MLEIALLFALGFIAAFIDSIAGGGGLISVPGLLAMGVSPQIALGTNKLQGTAGALTSTITFVKAGKVDFGALYRLLPLTFIGTVLGVLVVRQISNEFLKPLVIVLLIVMVGYTMMKKNWGAVPRMHALSAKAILLVGLAAFSIGFYDGFFGPATGSMLIFVFLLTGLPFVNAAANAKVLNTLSNAVALGTFMIFGLVNYQYGLVMAFGGILGGFIGTKVAIKKEAKLIKPLFVMMSLGFTVKIAWDFFGAN